MRLFSAKPAHDDAPSTLLGVRFFAVLIDVCARFLIDAAFKQEVRAVTDKHIVHLWRRMLATCHTSLDVYGRDKMSDGAYVIMSNHQSVLDIPVLFAAVPGSLRMVAKGELRKVPIFGQALERAGFILVDRQNRHKAIHQLERAKDRLKEGCTVWISPEGTRARTRPLTLLPFKKGGFHTAIALKTPIVPCYIDGTADVIFADSIKVHPNKLVRVFFGDPIETKDLKHADIPALMEQVRSAMLRLSELVATTSAEQEVANHP